MSSSIEIMAEPLLVNTDHPCSQEEQDDLSNARRGGRQARWSSCPSSSTSCSEASTYFFYFRPKFVLAGFLFGAMMELVYVHTIMIRLGVARSALDEHSSTTTTTNANYSIRVETWTDLFICELSFLYSDVIFLLYILILTFHVLKKNLTVSLPIMAANWTVGMVLGLSVVVAILVGPKVVLQQQRLWQSLVSIVTSIALYFIVYAAAMEMQIHCMGPLTRSPPFGPSCASGDGGAKDNKAEQGTPPGDDVGSDRKTISLLEAHIV